MAGDEGTQTWPRKKEAEEYLHKHKIIEMLNNLTSQVMYDQPDNPREFMIDQIEKLVKSRTTQLDYPCLFDETNIRSVFSMMDPNGRGWITIQQYREALTSLGLKEFEQKPAGYDVNKIATETFVRVAKSGLADQSATFAKQ